MTKERRNTIAVWSAIGMIIFGAGLTLAGFIVEPVGQIDDSVLWVLGQALLYAGGIFGVTIYTKGKLDEIETRVNARLKAYNVPSEGFEEPTVEPQDEEPCED